MRNRQRRAEGRTRGRILAGELAAVMIGFALLGMIWVAQESGALLAVGHWVMDWLHPIRR